MYTQLKLGEMRDSRQPARTGAVEHASRRIYGVGSHYEETASEDIAS
jgi:hypothetical protein